jgi:GNAT superfamily N-acetyltransferase
LLGARPEACLLKTFYVARDHRGRGLGRKLYGLAEAFARYAGFSLIRLYSSRRFHLTAAFYLRNGFQLDESTNNAWEDDLYSKGLRGQAPAADSPARA